MSSVASTVSNLVRASFRAYETKDRSALEAILADDFTFTSPLDDAIDRERYFERCWPNSQHLAVFHLRKLFVEGNEAFVQYEAETTGGEKFRNTEFFTIHDGKIQKVEVFFGTETTEAAEEHEIRTVIQQWADAIRRKDTDAVLSCFADDSIRFYLAPPLQATMPLKENLERWFATFRGPIGYEIRDLRITTGGEVAYASSFNRISGTTQDGQTTDLWFRETLCFQKTDTRWVIAHTHESVPFLMDGSHQAAVDLQP